MWLRRIAYAMHREKLFLLLQKMNSKQRAASAGVWIHAFEFVFL